MNSKKFYPVIHCIELSQGGESHALANARIARDSHADGVFLIGHNMNCYNLCYIYDQVRAQHADMWIGINFLDVSIHRQPTTMLSIIQTCRNLNALWTDEMPLNPIWKNEVNVDIFAGVAFKYIDPRQDGAALASSCEDAMRFASVATTSGDKTGSPPSVEKLKEIRRLLAGRLPLAVASGVSAKNVTAMKPFVDIFMVASSIIERDQSRGGHEHLVPEKVRELADLIHG